MNQNNFNSTVEWAKRVIAVAKKQLARGIDPLKVHEWMMRQGMSIEEADRVTGCVTK